jgi:hypothetical protein
MTMDRDLCVVARADDHVSPEECQVIERVSSALEVPLDVVSGTLCGECECDSVEPGGSHSSAKTSIAASL